METNKRILLSLVFRIIACNIHAQHQLTGVVKDSSNGEAVAYATVALMSAADSSIVTGVTTDTAGVFRLENVRTGSWYHVGDAENRITGRTDITPPLEGDCLFHIRQP